MTLQLRRIRKSFGSSLALQGVDLEIRPGEVHAVLGENGAGKSTLMKILAGVFEPDSGEMILAGAPYRPRGPSDALELGVAMIHQELSLCPHLTVEENIALACLGGSRWGLLSRKQMRTEALRILQRVSSVAIDPARKMRDLPLASQQLVEIAKALSTGARILVLDEPTSALPKREVDALFGLIAELKTRGSSIVYISHFLEEVRIIADRYTVLRDGQTVGTGEVKAAVEADWIRLMVGRDLTDLYPRSEHHPKELLLDLAEGQGRSGLQVHRGEVFGVAGLIGAGRTRLLRKIFGLERGDPQLVWRSGGFAGAATPHARWARKMGFVSENRKSEGLALNLSISDNLLLPSLPAYGARLSATQEWIAKMRIRCQGPTQRAGALSGGNQQKIALARGLRLDVDCLLLDEPTRGIDVGSKAEIYKLVDELASAGKAVIVVSSYLPELLGICDRIAVMRKGILGQPRAVGDWTEEKLLEEAVG